MLIEKLSPAPGFEPGFQGLRAGVLPTAPSRRIAGLSQNFSLNSSPVPSGAALVPLSVGLMEENITSIKVFYVNDT